MWQVTVWQGAQRRRVSLGKGEKAIVCMSNSGMFAPPPPQQSPGPPAGGAESLGGASHKEFPMCKVGSDINKPITACSQDTRARAQVRVKWDSGFCGELENQRQTMSSSVNPGSRSSKQPSTRRMRRSAERRHGSRCVCFSVSSQPPRPFGSNSACRSQVG